MFSKNAGITSHFQALLKYSCIAAIIVLMACLPVSAMARQAQSVQLNANPSFDREMRESMQRMDKDMMAVPMTGSPDAEFIAMMIPHHQGAIDMATIYLKYGKDPVLRQQAESILANQPKEIEALQQRQAEIRS